VGFVVLDGWVLGKKGNILAKKGKKIGVKKVLNNRGCVSIPILTSSNI